MLGVFLISVLSAVSGLLLLLCAQAAEGGPAKAKKGDEEELDPTKYFENRCGSAVGCGYTGTGAHTQTHRHRHSDTDTDTVTQTRTPTDRQTHTAYLT